MSDFIPEDFIQKVLEDSDIVSLVDSYVPLKRKGKVPSELFPVSSEEQKNQLVKRDLYPLKLFE